MVAENVCWLVSFSNEFNLQKTEMISYSPNVGNGRRTGIEFILHLIIISELS